MFFAISFLSMEEYILRKGYTQNEVYTYKTMLLGPSFQFVFTITDFRKSPIYEK